MAKNETENKVVELMETFGGKVVEVHISGKLEKADYEAFSPELDRLVEKHGKLRMVVVLNNFHGWTAGALWEDIKIDLKHFNHVERLAIVGDSKWEKGMAAFCKPFTTAKVKYFDQTQLAEARRWIGEELSASFSGEASPVRG